MRTAYSAVLFDLDGVLIDSLAVMESAYAVATKGTYAPPFASFRGLLGRPLPEMARRLWLASDFCERYRTAREAEMPRIPVQPGITPMLADLRQAGILLAVVTGKDGVAARQVLDALGLQEYFTVTLGSDEVQNPKPAAGHAVAALAALGVAPQRRVLMVGDADVDIRCGRDAGCTTAFAQWGYSELDELTATPDYVLEKPSQLRDLVWATLS